MMDVCIIVLLRVLEELRTRRRRTRRIQKELCRISMGNR